MRHVHNCKWCNRELWVLGDSNVLVCTSCDLAPLSSIPNGDQLRKQ
jgi:hypothetical protein